jgi:stage 0 sporulation regulatory protein
MLEDIQKLRVKMIDSAQKNGLTSEITIQYSQELDQLIYKYQRMDQIRAKQPNEGKWTFIQRILMWPKSLIANVKMHL